RDSATAGSSPGGPFRGGGFGGGGATRSIVCSPPMGVRSIVFAASLFALGCECGGARLGQVPGGAAATGFPNPSGKSAQKSQQIQASCPSDAPQNCGDYCCESDAGC